LTHPPQNGLDASDLVVWGSTHDGLMPRTRTIYLPSRRQGRPGRGAFGNPSDHACRSTSAGL